MNYYEVIKNHTIEEMADFIKPMFNECYGCENKEKDLKICECCTDENQRNNIIKILKIEQLR